MPLSHSSTLSFPPIVAALLFILSTTSSSQDVSYSNCNRTFSCGSFHNITYPFTGGDRPDYCGAPDFRLNCRDNYTELTANSITYRVLQINQSEKTLTLARLDLWNNSCPQTFVNSTLNSTIFNTDVGNGDLTMMYGCSSTMNYTPQNLFSCNVNGVNSSDSFYLTGPVPRDPIISFLECNVSIVTPVIGDAGVRLTSNRSTLEEVLMQGFNVNYSDPYDNQCSQCIENGGQCGFESSSGQAVCICGDRPCPAAGSTSHRMKFTIIGISIAVAVSILIFTLIICYHRREVKELVSWKKKTTNDQNVEAFIGSHGFLAPKQYKYSDVKRITNSFIDKIGQGGYGSVYKGKLSDGLLVAVKLLSETKGNGDEFINEVATISRTSHINVVTLLGFCYERNKRALIYEFMSNGSLDKFIYNASVHLEWKTLYQIAIGIARGLEYLHRGCNTRIVHFDIKPHNILLDEHFCPKISDFGLAKLCKRNESIVSMLGARGTVGYIAPEVFCRNFGRVSHKSDVYSYGMMVLEMVGVRKKNEVEVVRSSEVYFPDWIFEHLEHGADARLDGVITEEEEETARKMIVVSLWCIQTNPLERPSMNKVVEMLEGSLQSLQIPPKPFLFSPKRLAQDSSASLSYN
ncbi:hypothetical protein F0562_004213 [Nyssa sinensis]|uniref:non-specific serine/threonine protein kinase n=1 Tax=Nyssa sinensis TaxID=561372 RepID=A0A5J5BYQ6_9ASTE|nr:hypothetical protein F0562_004213 [Nyssa sinensis]